MLTRPADWTEVLGFGTGALRVFLATRRNIWNFPTGIAINVVFIVLFVGAALCADAGLQVVYLVLGVGTAAAAPGTIRDGTASNPTYSSACVTNQ